MRIHKGDEWKTAFCASTDHYSIMQYLYGLSFAPNVFQCLINDVLQDMLGRFVIANMDNIQYPSLQDHIYHVKQVLLNQQLTLCESRDV